MKQLFPVKNNPYGEYICMASPRGTLEQLRKKDEPEIFQGSFISPMTIHLKIHPPTFTNQALIK